MFGKRRPSDPSKRSAILADLERSTEAGSGPVETELGPTEIPVSPSRAPSPRAQIDLTRRSVEARVPTRPAASRPHQAQATTETPAMTPATPETAPTATSEIESRTLVVGRGIRLSGEITTCDKLVVEGRVEADLADSQDLEISGTGLYKGSASVQRAVISGHFQGALTVHERLLIRAGGRVSGNLTYANLEVERGGLITGTIALMGEEEAAEARPEEATPPPPEIKLGKGPAVKLANGGGDLLDHGAPAE